MSNAYTERETKQLIEDYIKKPSLDTVKKLSVKFNKPTKSVISKLVKEGVYEKEGYRTKLGEKPVTKIELVREIEHLLDSRLIDLDKCPKTTLKTLKVNIEQLIQHIDSMAATLGDQKHQIEMQTTMLKSRDNEIRNSGGGNAEDDLLKFVNDN